MKRKTKKLGILTAGILMVLGAAVMPQQTLAATALSGNSANNLSAEAGTDATAVGDYAKAKGMNSVAIGYKAEVEFDAQRSIAIGHETLIKGEDSVAIGDGLLIDAAYATAVGGDSIVTNNNGSAFGYRASATAKGAQAFGYNAQAKGENSVAIGINSVANFSNVVSFGHKSTDTYLDGGTTEKKYGSDSFARLVNVAGGTTKNEVATWDQLISSASYDASSRKLTLTRNNEDTITVTIPTSGGSATYSEGDHIDLTGDKISVKTGTVASGQTELVTGEAVYDALLKQGETYAISASQNTAQILNNDNSVAFTISVAGLDTGGGTASGTGADSLQIGNGADAAGDNSIAFGVDAKATKKNSIAFGVDAEALGENSIAIGTGHKVTGKNSGAFGDPTIINSDNSYSVGNDNEISGENTFVLGNKVKTSAKNAVILGDGSMATEDNVVSVGAEGNERKIINVKAGENSTDAVNKKQMEDAIDEALADIGVGMTEQLHRMDHDIAKVGAGAAALAALHPENFDPADKWSFAVGYGHYKNANSGALGAFYKPNFDTTLSIGSTIGNGDPMLNAGVSFKLGRRSEKLSQNASNSQLVQEVNALRADNNRLRDDSRVQAEKIERLEAQVAALLAKVGNR